MHPLTNCRAIRKYSMVIHSSSDIWFCICQQSPSNQSHNWNPSKHQIHVNRFQYIKRETRRYLQIYLTVLQQITTHKFKNRKNSHRKTTYSQIKHLMKKMGLARTTYIGLPYLIFQRTAYFQSELLQRLSNSCLRSVVPICWLFDKNTNLYYIQQFLAK